jgi:DNA-binding transcriptional ArsR family regulator
MSKSVPPGFGPAGISVGADYAELDLLSNQIGYNAIAFILYFQCYGIMETTTAVKRLSALAQEARLEVFRLLVKAGPEGMAAGDIARALAVPANTLSAQLLVLANAELLRARRDGRSIIYAVNFDAMRDLLVFLTEDCCGGRAEMCAPLAAIAETKCCDTDPGEQHEAPAHSRRGG